jgi:hypothetical protein
MVKLSLSLAETSLSDPEAVVCFFWNVDVRGIAAGEPTLPINTAPLRLWPEGGEQPVWGVTPWGTLVWSDNLPRNANGKHVVDVRLETPPVCFGTVRIAAVAMDALGNQQADPPADPDWSALCGDQ